MKFFHVRNKLLFIVLLIVATLSSCDLSNTDLPIWELEILGPIAQTSVSLEEIPEFSEFSYTGEITSQEVFGVSNVTLPVFPATSQDTVGPFTGETDEFVSVTFETGDIDVSLTNDFPVNIKQNSILIVNSGSENIFQHTIAQDIDPGETYSFALSNGLAGKTLENELEILIKDFSTDGSATPVTFNSNSKISYTFALSNATIEEIRIQSGNDFSADSDFADFSFTGDEIDIQSITGDLKVKVTNSMPVVLSLQVLFYDANKSEPPLDSLFASSQTVPAASVDNDGVPILEASTELVATIDEAKYEQIKSAQFVKTRIELSSLDGVPSVLLSKSDSLTSKVIGDLLITIDPQ